MLALPSSFALSSLVPLLVLSLFSTRLIKGTLGPFELTLFFFLPTNKLGISCLKPNFLFYFLFLHTVLVGMIIFHNRHKNAKGPLHLVHSENWVVYMLYNTKSRRYEISVLEIYEGHTRRNR